MIWSPLLKRSGVVSLDPNQLLVQRHCIITDPTSVFNVILKARWTHYLLWGLILWLQREAVSSSIPRGSSKKYDREPCVLHMAGLQFWNKQQRKHVDFARERFFFIPDFFFSFFLKKHFIHLMTELKLILSRDLWGLKKVIRSNLFSNLQETNMNTNITFLKNCSFSSSYRFFFVMDLNVHLLFKSL